MRQDTDNSNASKTQLQYRQYLIRGTIMDAIVSRNARWKRLTESKVLATTLMRYKKEKSDEADN